MILRFFFDFFYFFSILQKSVQDFFKWFTPRNESAPYLKFYWFGAQDESAPYLKFYWFGAQDWKLWTQILNHWPPPLVTLVILSHLFAQPLPPWWRTFCMAPNLSLTYFHPCPFFDALIFDSLLLLAQLQCIVYHTIII